MIRFGRVVWWRQDIREDVRGPKAVRSRHSPSPGTAQTVSEYRALMPLVGMTRLANITGLLDRCSGLRRDPPQLGLLATSQGKVLDDDAAKASALMEGIETWHAETMTNPVRWESFQALARAAAAGGGDAVIDPVELLSPAVAARRGSRPLGDGLRFHERTPVLGTATP